MRTWFITGVSSGFGRALADRLLEKGERVVGTLRNAAAVAEFDQLAPGRSFGVLADVTNEAAVRRAIEDAEERTGGIDVLVNNAGYGLEGALEELSLAQWRHQFDVNVFGAVAVMQAALPYMRKRRKGHILNITSMGGLTTFAGISAYNGSKFALEGISEALAKEVAPFGIKVTIVEPGGFRTDFAGSSTTINTGRPEYDSTVGAAARFQRDFDGKQPGDPAKAANVILQIAGMAEPPLRLLLGSDAVRVVDQADQAKAESDRKWRHLSVSTDFDGT